eukprot:m.30747 g.30747  ORF g.30747 m.30747 type:complete len:207 (+) comp14627_c0_seq2:1-621(+)
MTEKADLKIVIIGESGVGKTAIMHKFVHDDFQSSKATIGVSFVLKEWKGLHLAIWDTAGQEKYAPLSSFYSRDAAAAIVVYDVTDRNSFDNLEKYWSCLKHAKDDCYVVIVGNKYDLVQDRTHECEVPAEDAKALTRLKGGIFFETSAKTGLNVDGIFDGICKKLLPKKYNERSTSSLPAQIRTDDSSNSTIKLAEKRPSESSKCC